MLNGGTYTTISFPNSVSTTATGINQLGQVVGYCVDAAGNDDGFLYNNGTYTTIDVPGAQFTQAFGMNAEGEIVGTYFGASGELGFTAAPAPSRPPSSP